MSKLRIKNFGPIKKGYLEKDGWLDVKKVTVFIGNQGCRKSTVAKLISTLSWIEKAMVMGTIRQDELNTHNRFLKQLAYQRIEKYANPETSIEYIGKAFTLSYSDGKFEAQKSKENGYLLPKIMYAPAERNFLSSVDRPDKLRRSEVLKEPRDAVEVDAAMALRHAIVLHLVVGLASLAADGQAFVGNLERTAGRGFSEL